ncbi:MAG: tRNA lysidine(34) synthetase TilS [Eubacteriales bacterium]
MSSDIALKVHSFIKGNQLIAKNETVVVGLSGGVDSMVLCDILMLYKREVNFKIFAAHMDHRLRDESGEDAFFVAAYCSKNNIPLYTASADVQIEASEAKVSIETAARYMRHGFFTTIINEHKNAKLALAHHMNDMAETILMRLIRGSSIDGLSPMPEKDGHIIRPLMCLTREEVMQYAKEQGIKWCEDKSNSDTKYTRNYIRHELIPEIEKNINPSVVHTLCSQAKSFKEDSGFMGEIAHKAAKKAKKTDNGYMMSDEDFMYLHPSIRKRTIKILMDKLGKKFDLYEKNINAIDALFSQRRTGAVIEIPGEYEARAHVMGVELVKKDEAKSPLEETIMAFDGATYLSTGDIIICEMAEKQENWSKPHSKNIQYIDYLKLQEQPFIRPRQEGDVIHPLGASGKKKMKDYFIDKKINRWERDSIPLIAIGNEIIWVAGVGVSEKYKIDDSTTLALKISYKKGEYNE